LVTCLSVVHSTVNGLISPPLDILRHESLWLPMTSEISHPILFGLESMFSLSYHQTTYTDVNLSSDGLNDLLENDVFHHILKLNLWIRPLCDVLFNNEIILILLINNLSDSDFEVSSLSSKFIKLHELKLLFIPVHGILVIVLRSHV
jgi:hypothetical protein